MDNKKRKLYPGKNDVQKECQEAEIAALKQKLEYKDMKLKLVTAELEQLKEEQARERINFEKEKSILKSEIEKFKEQCTELQNAKERLQKLGQKLLLEKVKESHMDFFAINSLPEELILKVFSFLTQNELGKIARVCKAWSTLIKTPVLWKNVNVVFNISHECQNTVTKSFISQLPACVTNMKLDYMCTQAWTGRLDFKEFSMMLQEKCPDLETLFLNLPEVTSSLQSVLDLCTLFLQNVKKFGLHLPVFTDSPSAEECGDAVCKIEALEVSSAPLENFNKPLFSKMPHLKELHLSSGDIEDDYFDNCTSLWGQLHTLDLGDTWAGSNTFQAIRNHAVNLKGLYLCGTDVADSDLKFDYSVFTQLKTICLQWCQEVTCDGVVSLIQSCQSLENVIVKEEVAKAFAAHPFVVDNKCKLNIVKYTGCYHRLFERTVRAFDMRFNVLVVL